VRDQSQADVGHQVAAGLWLAGRQLPEDRLDFAHRQAARISVWIGAGGDGHDRIGGVGAALQRGEQLEDRLTDLAPARRSERGGFGLLRRELRERQAVPLPCAQLRLDLLCRQCGPQPRPNTCANSRR
jgi:hypothetical protein